VTSKKIPEVCAATRVIVQRYTSVYFIYGNSCSWKSLCCNYF